MLALIEAASAIDEPVSKETLARAELARRMRQENKTWKEIAAELGVAQSTAIWLAGRHRREATRAPAARSSPRSAAPGFATARCASWTSVISTSLTA